MNDREDRLLATRESFARVNLMTTLGARLDTVAPGAVSIVMPFAPHLLQQHGFVHAGVLSAIADTACGYAAFTLMPAGSAVLTAEFKINLMSPARAPLFRAEARVVRAGRRLHVASAEVFGVTDEDRKCVALMTATLMVIEGEGLSG